MAKIISIADDVYKKLKYLKGKESYSELIRKVLAKRSNKEEILAFVGKGGIDEKKITEAREFLKKWPKKYV